MLELPSPLISLLSLTFLAILLFLISFIIIPLKNIHARKQEGVTTYFFPVIGYLNYFAKGLREKGDVMGFSKDYPPNVPRRKYIASHVGRTNLTVLQDPQYIKEFLQKPFYYQKSDMVESLKPMSRTGLVFAEGETWKRHRKIISSSFNFDFIKSNIDVIQRTANEFFDKLDPSDYKDYSVISRIQQITGEVVGKIFFGEHLNGYTFEGKSLTLAVADATSELGYVAFDAMFLLFGPRVLNRPIIPKYRRIMHRVAKLKKFCLDIVRERKLKPQDYPNNDLLSSLLAAQKSEDVGKLFTDEDIVNEFLTFFVAGMDTTGHLIGMTLYNLTQHPEYLAQLQAEREATYNKDSPLTNETLSKMNLLHAFLKETLRFYTPAPSVFIREAVEDHNILDIKVKKGEFVLPNLLSSAFDERNFRNPKEFDPSRWINPDAKMDPYAFIPFSAGPRNCIGQHLAMIEAKIIVSEFLERFEFELEKGYELRMRFTFLYEPERELKFELRPKGKSVE